MAKLKVFLLPALIVAVLDNRAISSLPSAYLRYVYSHTKRVCDENRYTYDM